MNWWRLRRKVHTSWLVAYASLGILVGAVLAQYVDQILFSSIAWLLTASALIGTGLLHRKIYLIPVVICGGVLLGLWRGSVEQGHLAVYQQLFHSQVTLTGTVSEDRDVGKKNEVLLRLNNISIADMAIAGKIWVSSKTDADIKRGDSVTVEGNILPGFGTFSASIYQAKIVKVQRPEPGDVARQVRDWFADAVRVAIPDPEASLGIGYLVGQRRALPPELDQALTIAGLTHIVVASGYNLTILVRLARRLFMRISRYTAALAGTGMMVSFIAITGNSPSMARAGLVTGLSLLAWYYGRKFHPLVLLPFAAAITVLVEPSYAWGDLGWELSFAAFAGVMILAPLLQAYFFGDKKPGTLRQILGETVSAQIVTLPILVLAFGQFSNVAVIANILILPLVPLAMLLTFIAGIGALTIPVAATVIGLPAYGLLHYMTNVAMYVSSLPWAQSQLTINIWWVGGYYLVLAILCIYLQRVTMHDLSEDNIIA